MQWVFLNGSHLTGPAGTVALPSGTLCTLAAVLVLNHGTAVQRDRLDDILWDGVRPERARDRLNTMLWRLRRLVKSVGGSPDSFANRRDFLMYRAPRPPESDVAEVSRLARTILRDGLRTAKEVEECLACVGACHTDFLPHAADHWSIVTRESLRSGLLMIVEALIAHMRERGRWGRVAELVERMLSIDPTIEICHRQLIDMHGARRDMSSAVRHYSVLRKVLRDSLDVDPAPETAAAIDALRIARRTDPEPGSGGDGRARPRTLVTRRPSLQSVQGALGDLEAARDKLLR